jgi:hypothetical protein
MLPYLLPYLLLKPESLISLKDTNTVNSKQNVDLLQNETIEGIYLVSHIKGLRTGC